MATFTQNLNLEKPAQDDFYDIDVQNANMDKIDEFLGEMDAASNVETYTTLEEIGLTTGSETIASIVANTPNDSVLMIATSASNNMSIYPGGHYGLLLVFKKTNARALLIYSKASANEFFYGNYYNSADAENWSGWIGFLPLSGGELTGELNISSASPAFRLTDTQNNRGSKLHKNAGSDVDYGTYISDFASDGSYDTLILRREGSTVGDKLMLRVYSADGSASETYRIYHEGFKPTPASIGAATETAVQAAQTAADNAATAASNAQKTADTAKSTADAALPKAGGTITGAFQIQRTMSDGTVVRTNAYPYNYALNSEFISSLIHSRDGVQKMMFLFNETGAALYDLTTGTLYPIYSAKNKPSADDLDVLSRAGGTLRSALVFDKGVSNGYARIIKNHNASADYGLNLNDFDASDNVVKLIVSAKNNKITFSTTDGSIYELFHEGHKPTADEVGATPSSHASNTSNPHSVTKSQVGLGNVTNNKQMPIAGGTFTGNAKAYATNRAGECLRNITVRNTAGTTDQSTNFIRFDRKS